MEEEGAARTGREQAAGNSAGRSPELGGTPRSQTSSLYDVPSEVTTPPAFRALLGQLGSLLHVTPPGHSSGGNGELRRSERYRGRGK